MEKRRLEDQIGDVMECLDELLELLEKFDRNLSALGRALRNRLLEETK